jgi:hypothetical protein
VTATEKEYVEYRIMSKKPGERAFKFRRFTGAGPHRSPEHATKGFQWAQEASPEWEFRIERRLVTVTCTRWEPVRKAVR